MANIMANIVTEHDMTNIVTEHDMTNVVTEHDVTRQVGEEECRPAVPALPVARRGMVGGWVGGLALVCGGEDETGHIGAECFYYRSSPVTNNTNLL